MSTERKHVPVSFSHIPLWKKGEAELQKIITFWYQRAESCWSLRTKNLHILQPYSSQRHFLLSLCAFMCLLGSRGSSVYLCLHIVCCLVFDRSLHASENKSNVSNYTWFQWVDASSWLQTCEAVVYEINAFARTSFSTMTWRCRGGEEATELPVSEAWGTRALLPVFYSLHIRKAISALSSRECLVHNGDDSLRKGRNSSSLVGRC